VTTPTFEAIDTDRAPPNDNTHTSTWMGRWKCGLCFKKLVLKKVRIVFLLKQMSWQFLLCKLCYRF